MATMPIDLAAVGTPESGPQELQCARCCKARIGTCLRPTRV